MTDQSDHEYVDEVDIVEIRAGSAGQFFRRDDPVPEDELKGVIEKFFPDMDEEKVLGLADSVARHFGVYLNSLYAAGNSDADAQRQLKLLFERMVAFKMALFGVKMNTLGTMDDLVTSELELLNQMLHGADDGLISDSPSVLARNRFNMLLGQLAVCLHDTRVRMGEPKGGRPGYKRITNQLLESLGSEFDAAMSAEMVEAEWDIEASHAVDDDLDMELEIGTERAKFVVRMVRTYLDRAASPFEMVIDHACKDLHEDEVVKLLGARFRPKRI